jgi:hypothetical protein
MSDKPEYWYPEDIEVYVKNGVRYARPAWWKPCAWDAIGVLRLALKDSTAGWMLAREEQRKREWQDWLHRFYPLYIEESKAFRKHIAKGGSVSSFRVEWKKIKVDRDV